MFDQVYRELARKLDSIPPGLPATESGVELQLLARLYTREEATIVTAMRLTYETADDIAARAAMDPGAAYDILNGAARKGLVRTRTEKQERTFALKLQMGGIVGYSYKEVLRRADAKTAELYVQWVQETRGGGLSDYPPALRVIAVEEAIPFSLAIHPYEQASEILATAKSWGVADCMCRARTRQAGQGCSYPLENCLFMSPDEGAFEDDELIRPISQEESLRILRESTDRGLVHQTYNIGDYGGDYGSVICNCCPCCCNSLRGVVEFHRPTVVAHSDFRATVDETACEGCGDCVERCHFNALFLPEGVCVVDHARCMGCGLCAVVCSNDALSLVRRPEGETPPHPADSDEWTAAYAKRRGISLTELQ
jgi:electron transport complex protein RnfB